MGNSVMLNGGEYAGEQIAYKDSTYELVSKVAYLIGVPLRIFQNEHEPPKIEIYDRLEQDKNARIIRNLCIIRTAIERNYRKINDIMRMEYRGLLSMPEILPMSSIVCIIDRRLRDEPPERYHDITWDSLPIKNRTSSLDELRKFYEGLPSPRNDDTNGSLFGNIEQPPKKRQSENGGVSCCTMKICTKKNNI